MGFAQLSVEINANFVLFLINCFANVVSAGLSSSLPPIVRNPWMPSSYKTSWIFDNLSWMFTLSKVISLFWFFEDEILTTWTTICLDSYSWVSWSSALDFSANMFLQTYTLVSWLKLLICTYSFISRQIAMDLFSYFGSTILRWFGRVAPTPSFPSILSPLFRVLWR